MKQLLIEILTGVACSCISLAGTYATFYFAKAKQKLNSEIIKLDNENQREGMIAALNSLDILVEKTVAQIEQTTAKELRELVRDGKADKSMLKQLSKNALTEIKDMLAPEYETVLRENVTNLDKFIQYSIEQQVLKLKTVEAVK